MIRKLASKILSVTLIGLMLAGMFGVASSEGPYSKITTQGSFDVGPYYLHRVYYHNGLWWVFGVYMLTTAGGVLIQSGIGYSTSSDGVTWSILKLVGTQQIMYSIQFDVKFNGEYIEYISSASNLVYRKGVLQGNGNIQWLSDEQIVSSYEAKFRVSLLIDEEGYAYIFYSDSNNLDIYMMKNRYLDGNWATDYKLLIRSWGATPNHDPIVLATRLLNNRIYIISGAYQSWIVPGALYGRVFDVGTKTLGSEELIIDEAAAGQFPAMVSFEDNVYLLFENRLQNEAFMGRQDGSWTSQMLVQIGTFGNWPTLEVDPKTGILYTTDFAPSGSSVFFKEYKDNLWTEGELIADVGNSILEGGNQEEKTSIGYGNNKLAFVFYLGVVSTTGFIEVSLDRIPPISPWLSSYQIVILIVVVGAVAAALYVRRLARKKRRRSH